MLPCLVPHTGKPRGDEQPGEVNVVNGDPVSVTFDLTAFPMPHQVTFACLGPSVGCLGNGQPVAPGNITLDGRCGAKPGVVYVSVCTVTVTTVTSADATGFYRVTVTNTQGSGHFRVHVRHKGQAAKVGH